MKRACESGPFFRTNLSCHGPQKWAIQANVRRYRRTDARLLGGPVERGHDKLSLTVQTNYKIKLTAPSEPSSYGSSTVRRDLILIVSEPHFST